MGLSPFETFLKIRLPNALPSIFAGLKISITLAVVGAVVGEFVGGDAGLGYLLMVANGSMDTALLFGGLIALTFLGVVFFVFIGETATRDLRPQPGLELAWHPIDGLGDLPLVDDLEELLPRLWTISEPLFATEVYDGGDRRLSIRFEGEGEAARPAGPVGLRV